MTLEELERTLPGGFHDAEFRSIYIDYAKHRVVVDARLDVGDPDGVTAPKEAMRDAEVVIEGVHFVAIDPPASSEYLGKNHLRVDLAKTPSAKELPAMGRVPEDCFASGFFVYDWNAFIYVAAKSASLTWKGELYER